MSEKIFLDLETTGLDYKNDKIIEICCIKLINRKLSNKKIHFYLNPLMKISKEAKLIHGIEDDFLKDKPLFSDVIKIFLKFILKKKIIIHNSKFDVSFLNKELLNIGLKPFTRYCNKIIDTLDIARKIFPGKKNSLDFLCKRYNIDISHRKTHSACLDVKLLSEVYILMTQKDNKLSFKKNKEKKFLNLKSNNILVIPDEIDLICHQNILNKINGKS